MKTAPLTIAEHPRSLADTVALRRSAWSPEEPARRAMASARAPMRRPKSPYAATGDLVNTSFEVRQHTLRSLRTDPSRSRSRTDSLRAVP